MNLIFKNHHLLILHFNYSRYSKRPLRGPYGQMLEAEMAKPKINETDKKRKKVTSNLSFNASNASSDSEIKTPCHHRTTSSPSKLEGLPGPSPELLADLLKGSSERVARVINQSNVSFYLFIKFGHFYKYIFIFRIREHTLLLNYMKQKNHMLKLSIF